MTEAERRAIERVLRAAVTAAIEKSLPIHLAVRGAVVALLQAGHASAATSPQERPSDAWARENALAMTIMHDHHARGQCAAA